MQQNITGKFPELLTMIQGLVNQIIQTGPGAFVKCALCNNANVTKSVEPLAGSVAPYIH